MQPVLFGIVPVESSDLPWQRTLLHSVRVGMTVPRRVPLLASALELQLEKLLLLLTTCYLDGD